MLVCVCVGGGGGEGGAVVVFRGGGGRGYLAGLDKYNTCMEIYTNVCAY